MKRRLYLIVALTETKRWSSIFKCLLILLFAILYQDMRIGSSHESLRYTVSAVGRQRNEDHCYLKRGDLRELFVLQVSMDIHDE